MTDLKNSNQQPADDHSKISKGQPAGDDLLSDSESYMEDLSEDELNTTHGGNVVLDVKETVEMFLDLNKKNPNPDVMGSVMSGPAGGAACYMRNNP